MAATPPAEPQATTPAPTTAPPAPPSLPTALPDQPTLSTATDPLARRPRDARVLHLVLSTLGIHSYQERVPLQLLDFAYRYTSGVLADSLRLSAEGYTSSAPGAGGKRGAAAAAAAAAAAGEGAGGDGANMSVAALRQAIASRVDNSFVTSLPKEWMLELAAERNRVALPRIERGFGPQLPAERYVFTGTGWRLEEMDEEDGSEYEEEGEGVVGAGGKDEVMGGTGAEGEGDQEEEEEEEEERFEDVFGNGDEMKDD